MEISREELYELVWKEPITAISKRLGVKDSELRKECKKANIPLPILGYWSKLKYNKEVEVTPLPQWVETAKSKTKIVVAASETESGQLKMRIAEIKSDNTKPFKVSRNLNSKNPLIISAMEQFKDYKIRVERRNTSKGLIPDTLNIIVSKELIDRALRIFAAIITGLEFRGYSVVVENCQTFAIIGSERVAIRIFERLIAEKNPAHKYLSYINHLSGVLVCSVYDNLPTYRKYFDETELVALEDKIIDIVAYIEVKAESFRSLKECGEQQTQIKQKEQAEKDVIESARISEISTFNQLLEDAASFDKAMSIRRYIDYYESFKQQTETMTADAISYIQWARAKADWLDPLIKTPETYLDTICHQDIFTKKH